VTRGRPRGWGAAAAAVALLGSGGACGKAASAPLYEKVPLTRRDLVVTVVGLGVIEPELTFSVKSKAWGAILQMPVQTGDEVHKDQLLASIDPRIPQANLTEAQATVEKATAQLATAAATLKRGEALFRSQAIDETDYEAAKLAAATARAGLVTAQAALQTAQDAMEDTHVRAPITGTVLELDAVLGSMISSPTLGGGTVILKMANLDTVVDSALVIETDIAKVQPGMPVTLAVDAYPNQTFDGSVLKILPQAEIYQNATMFPVLVGIPNPRHLLRPGMNTEVRIHIGQQSGVLAVPNAALRTPRDVAAGATVLGLDPQVVEQEIAAAQANDTTARARRAGGDTAGTGTGPGGTTLTLPSGVTITLPPDVTAAQVQAAFAKRRSGADLTAPEQALLAQLRSQFARPSGAGPGGAGRAGGGRAGASTSYVVFVLRGGKLLAVPIRTGLTDLDYSEVTRGLADGDTVLVLPSASLVQAQQQFRQRFQNVTGGGLPGLRQQQAPGAAAR